MKTVREIIELMGGDQMVAECIGVRRSSVRMWRVNRTIPIRHHETLLQLAVGQGVNIVRDDLLELSARMRGWVYVIDNPRIRNALKIGNTTVSIESRIRALAGGSPEPYRCRHSVEFANAPVAEREAHEKLAKFSCGGEWFALPLKDAVRTLDELTAIRVGR